MVARPGIPLLRLYGLLQHKEDVHHRRATCMHGVVHSVTLACTASRCLPYVETGSFCSSIEDSGVNLAR